MNNLVVFTAGVFMALVSTGNYMLWVEAHQIASSARAELVQELKACMDANEQDVEQCMDQIDQYQEKVGG